MLAESTVVHALPIVLAAALLVVQGLAELAAMYRTGALRRRRTPEWTFRAVNLPYRLMFLAGILQQIRGDVRSGIPVLAVGTVIAAAGVLLRVLCHFQLGYHFSPYVELADEHTLTERGLYRYVRHPMYLGTLLILVGVPMMLSSPWSAMFALLAAAGLWARIRKEEQFLSQKLPGYGEYATRTWRLVPWVW